MVTATVHSCPPARPTRAISGHRDRTGHPDCLLSKNWEMAAMLIQRARARTGRSVKQPDRSPGQVQHCGPELLFRAFATLTLGAAALGGLSSVTGEAVQRSLDFLAGPEEPRPEMPHRVLVVVTADAVTAFGLVRPTAGRHPGCTVAGRRLRCPRRSPTLRDRPHNRRERRRPCGSNRQARLALGSVGHRQGRCEVGSCTGVTVVVVSFSER